MPCDATVVEKRKTTDDRRRGCVGLLEEAKQGNLGFLTQTVIA